MFWDWLYRLMHRRQLREDLRDLDEMAMNWHLMQCDLNKRIAESFSPQEWNETRERCERMIREAAAGAAAKR